jgi:glutamyl-Q tRNA(Asp) synthetase
MEDLDPPREPSGAADLILLQLQALGLQWDDEVLYQSSRLDAYGQALDRLTDSGLCFACDCTRGRIQAIGAVYDGHCRQRSIELAKQSKAKFAIRLKTSESLVSFEDQIQGEFQQNIRRDCGDFVIKRKDKLCAYQLAVVVDDAYQNITHVVRGHDLLDSTPRQIYLQQQLGAPQPSYAHFPVAADIHGEKLSKQHFAAAIDTNSAVEYLTLAMKFLGLDPSHADPKSTPASILIWGAKQWDIQRVPKLATISGSWSV